jgi:beta-1,2-mannobiose phosphorylase / 1,2-beta-oligomannan phosphorylase
VKQPQTFDRRLFLEATSNPFEGRAVLNPSIIQRGNDLHIYTRAVAQDWVSYIGYLKAHYEGSETVIDDRWTKPMMKPQFKWDTNGVEDPRVVEFEGKFYLFYTAYDGENAVLAMATSDGLTDFSDNKLVGPLITRKEGLDLIKDNQNLNAHRNWWSKEKPDGFLWEKDATIFPRRVNGKIVFIHRLRPNAQIAFLDSMDQLTDQDFWRDHIKNLDKHILLAAEQDWESSHMGLGAVPMETSEGWLLIYHGVTNNPVKTYRAGAALLDLDDPSKVIGRTKDPLFEPVMEWEKSGDVDMVVFPEGLAVRDDVLDIYYGGADSVIGRISVNMDELIDYLKNSG